MNSKVDLFCDLIDQATMILVESLDLDYLEALVMVSKALIDEEFDAKLSDDEILKLEEIFTVIALENFYNEEIRLSLEILIVKAFKHINYPLNLMTPDTINYLISSIVIQKFANQDISILDTALGTSNMMFAISNNFPTEVKMFGIENDLKLVELSKAASNLQSNDITIYFQDALNEVLDEVDLVIGDLDAYNIEDNRKLNSDLYMSGVRYLPYLVIVERLKNIKDNGYFIYLIENDFFNQDKNRIFNQHLQKEATLMGLILLPKTIFQENYIGKSILIGKKEVRESKDMMVIEISSFEENNLQANIQKLNKMITKL